ncbi:variable surface protein [Plasmodium gonderi]|uniref:Variable surface protein n=1 Tax=Plasmodium gonderi TaxID=77519 RepID=A0A1Y1JW14_PLAGO|nr:variable surface protein [Plasmodium gonderi]GAW84543.1 variable surface protein [Plasmodium gonderi]
MFHFFYNSFLTFNFQEIDTSELPSKKFYGILNSKSINLSGMGEFCILYKGTLNYNNEYINLCSKFVNYIKKKDDIWRKSSILGDHCNLFSYWLYEKLLSMLKQDTNTAYNIFDKIQDISYRAMVLQSKFNFGKCDLDRNDRMKDEFEKRKQFYDYCIDYNTIMKMYESDKVNCEKYYNYIKEKIDVYKHFKKLCPYLSSHNCPDIYAKCINFDPEKVIKKLDCYSQIKKRNKPSGYENEEKEEEQEEEQDEERKVEQEEKKEEKSGLPEQREEQGLTLIQEESLVDELKHSKVLTSYTPGESYAIYDNYSREKTFGKSILGVVMITMISGIIYKFTPLGKRLHHTIGRLKNAIINQKGDNNTTFSYTSEYDYPLNEYREEHFVGYNTY